ncbi:MAG: YeeE/YedE family protein [Myxococcales bacterium]|nr:YeeE/YedE family protein [Myxococcales bacterium]
MHSSILASLLGGVLIGTSALLLLWLGGRIAGVSGIVGGLLTAPPSDRAWRALFLVGLVLGGAALRLLDPAALPQALPAPLPVVVLAGVLVGWGSRAANGCTSGHGVCGLGRRSPRSLVAVVVFMTTGVLTANLVRPLLLGGAP